MLKRRRFLTRCLLAAAFLVLAAGGVSWRVSVRPARAASPLWQATAAPQRLNGLRRAASWRLDQAQLTSVLRQAPAEFSVAARKTPLILELPLPDGASSRFRVVDSPVMEAGLAARFPHLKTYAAQGVDDPTATARFSWMPNGLHAIILSAQGTAYIEPASPGDSANYLAYNHEDLPENIRAECVNPPVEKEAPLTVTHAPAVGETLRVYRLAVAATAEYTQFYGGGTVAGGLAAVTTTINLLDAIYERDAAVRMVLIDRESELIFTDTATDGFTSDAVNSLINESQSRLDAILGSAGYDIGHVIDGRAQTGGGFSYVGVAGIGAVCRDGLKGRGASILRSVNPSNIIAYFHVGHEMGHQFGANHTFNATSGNCASQRTASSAYEPATGSTIMAYRFNCAPEDIGSSTNSTYFHLRSIIQINDYVTIGLGSGCPTLITTNNRPPTINAGSDYNIPANTPFQLTATGGDPDGDAVIYGWEQYDLGNPAPPSTDDGTRPIFRSFDPRATPIRVFPRLSDILSGVPTLGESLPTTTRAMHFRVTARDNRASGGGVSFDEMLLNTRADAGPFLVTQPAAGASWAGGSTQTVTWNVANTNNAPINAANARILFSADGGQTFPFVLQNSTPNDGAESVVIPNVAAASARVRVEAVDNVFFNLSPAFAVTGSGATATLAFASAAVAALEGNDTAILTVNRSGDTSRPVAVAYATSDGTARQLGDYTVTNGALNFAAGETAKNIVIPIVNDAYAEGQESFTLTLSNPNGATINGATTAGILITDNDISNAGANPLENAGFFVRQQYYDFLNREPDAAGFDYWTGQITQCGSDPVCIRSRRIGVSAAFFIELEFQSTGSFVYRFYKASYGALPTYAQFTPDRARIVGGSELETARQAFADNWVQRPEFLARYPATQTSAQFVDTLLATVQQGSSVNLTANRNSLLGYLANGGTRAGVVRLVADNPVLQQAEFNKAFVLMQYFGYLRRDPDQAGYDFWLDVVTNREPGNYRGMVCAFITAAEHQLRFGEQTPRTNQECVPGV